MKQLDQRKDATQDWRIKDLISEERRRRVAAPQELTDARAKALSAEQEKRVREIVREEIDKYSVAVHGLTGILHRDRP